MGANNIAGATPGWRVAGLADFNGDGHPDLLWQNDSSRAVAIWYLAGAQGNVFQSASYITSGLPGWKAVGTADLNHDSKPDLLWQNDTDRSVWVWYLTGPVGNLFQSANAVSSGVPGWSLIVTQ